MKWCFETIIFIWIAAVTMETDQEVFTIFDTDDEFEDSEEESVINIDDDDEEDAAAGNTKFVDPNNNNISFEDNFDDNEMNKVYNDDDDTRDGFVIPVSQKRLPKYREKIAAPVVPAIEVHFVNLLREKAHADYAALERRRSEQKRRDLFIDSLGNDKEFAPVFITSENSCEKEMQKVIFKAYRKFKGYKNRWSPPKVINLEDQEAFDKLLRQPIAHSVRRLLLLIHFNHEVVKRFGQDYLGNWIMRFKKKISEMDGGKHYHTIMLYCRYHDDELAEIYISGNDKFITVPEERDDHFNLGHQVMRLIADAISFHIEK